MASINYVPLGTTGLEVSAVALGCMSLTPEREEDGKKAVARAFELGINLFDTADVYGRGDSEQILGRALREAGIDRDQVIIASKCGILFEGTEPSYQYKAYDLTREYVTRSCEESLRRLGTDYIDLYQPHRVDYLTHPEETAAALEDLKTAGKIRHAGVSNHTVDEIRALSSYLRLESLQTQFSLMHIEPLETGLTAVCLEKKMVMLCWSPLQKAVLAGTRPFPHADWQQQREAGMVEQLRPFAAEYGLTLAQLSLAWLMNLPGGVIPLVGSATSEHVTEAVGAAATVLERDDFYELMVIARGRPIPWHQRPFHYLEER